MILAPVYHIEKAEHIDARKSGGKMDHDHSMLQLEIGDKIDFQGIISCMLKMECPNGRC
jgi:hypothetical protein